MEKLFLCWRETIITNKLIAILPKKEAIEWLINYKQIPYFTWATIEIVRKKNET